MEAWERFLTALESDLGKETVEKWLRPLKVVDYDACNLYLEANDTFQLAWFEEQMRERVQKGLVNNNHRPIHIHLTTDSHAPVSKKSKKATSHPLPEHSFEGDVLDPNALIEKYVPGKNNEVAFKFLSSLAKGNEAAGTFNPVYIHGPSGTGKTHLLMALAHHMQKRGIKALYVRAETFTEHVVNAIRSGVMREFRQAYRHADALLIDDVHLFARKSATQEELFNTFNALHTTARQIFLSADKAPQFLTEIEARLISRFEWGIIFPLEALTAQEMEEVIVRRSESLGFILDSKTVSFLISQFHANAKSLHLAFDALILRSHMNGIKKMSVEIAESLIADLIELKEASSLTSEKIIRRAAEYYGIRPSDILGKSQSHDCTLPRQVAMYLCRTKLSLPFLKIAAIFDRDHSTVMTSVKQIQKKIDGNEKEIRFSIAEILKQM